MDTESATPSRLRRWGWPGSRRAVGLAAQVVIGAVLGIGLARLMDMPEEQTALIGTVITLITWLAEEAFRMPPRETRLGKAVHGTLRMLSLVGFMLAMQALLALNGWTGA